MKWNKLTIETTTAAEDMLSYELSEMGMEGVEIEDHVPLSEEDRKIMYVNLPFHPHSRKYEPFHHLVRFRLEEAPHEKHEKHKKKGFFKK